MYLFSSPSFSSYASSPAPWPPSWLTRALEPRGALERQRPPTHRKGERILLRYGFPIYSFLYPLNILTGATVGFTVAAELWLQILSRGHWRLLGRPRETPFQGNTFSEGVAPHTLSFAPALPPWMEDRGRMARPQASAQLKMKHGKVTL